MTTVALIRSYRLLAATLLALVAWSFAAPSPARASCGDYAVPIALAPHSTLAGSPAPSPMADHHNDHRRPCPNCSKNRQHTPPSSPTVTVSVQQQWAYVGMNTLPLDSQTRTHFSDGGLLPPWPLSRGAFHPPRLDSYTPFHSGEVQ